MLNAQLDRRQMLKRGGAGALGAAALAVLASTAGRASEKQGDQRVMGSWDVRIVPEPGGGAPFEQIFSFVRDGVFVAASGNSAPPGLGAWTEDDDGRFALTFMRFRFDPMGKPAGKLISDGGGAVREDERSIQGRVRVQFFDGAGRRLSATTATFRGTRIEVDPAALALAHSTKNKEDI